MTTGCRLFTVRNAYFIRDDIELCKTHVKELFSSNDDDIWKWINHIEIGLDLLQDDSILRNLNQSEVDQMHDYITDGKNFVASIRAYKQTHKLEG